MVFVLVLFLHFSLGCGLDFLKVFFFASSYLYFKVGKGILSSGQKNSTSNLKKDRIHETNYFPPTNQNFYFVQQKNAYNFCLKNSKLRFDLAQFFFQLCSFSSCFVLPPLLAKLSAPSCGFNKSIKMKCLNLNSNQQSAPSTENLAKTTFSDDLRKNLLMKTLLKRNQFI